MPSSRRPAAAGLLSDEHVTVARTQLDAWASRKSVQRPEAPRPHVAAKRQFSAIDRRTTRHPGYAVRQQTRTRVEHVFGWMKTGARGARSGTVAASVSTFPFAAAAYTLVRRRPLGAASG